MVLPRVVPRELAFPDYALLCVCGRRFRASLSRTGGRDRGRHRHVCSRQHLVHEVRSLSRVFMRRSAWAMND